VRLLGCLGDTWILAEVVIVVDEVAHRQRKVKT
jgi:hypothetical protein